MTSDTHIKFDPKAKHAGAKDMLDKEWAYLENNRDGFKKDKISGLALSGGGIRSASFCLGVVQALAANDQLKRFDYLSTVSGGGYLGGSLSWLWSGKWKEEKKDQDDALNNKEEMPVFGVNKDDFPYGTEGRRFYEDEEKHRINRIHASLLRHLRQHGKYLTPGRGITALSFISIILRSITMGFVTLMILVSFIFSLFYLFQIFQVNVGDSVFFSKFAGLLLLFGYVFLQIVYMAFLAIHKHREKSVEEDQESKQDPVQNKDKDKHVSGYLWRRRFETLLPIPLIIALVFYLFAAIHFVQVSLSTWVINALEVGSLSVALGGLLGAMGSESKRSGMLNFIPQSLKAVLGAILMIFGLLVLADFTVSYMVSQLPAYLHVGITGGASLLVLFCAFYLPINNISIHRYYRDRLMESFMPDVEQVIASSQAVIASKANAMPIHDLKLGENNQAPYHLVNTNIILVESKIAKFRGRGGDNFILSPLYCGSNATGWQESKSFSHGTITMPTAVAISGAAANPDAGVAGKGLTTNPVISILMSIFNLRLGYWASNPDPKYAYDFKMTPNYFNPGIVEVFQRNDMNEQAPFVQLSDGGHFENLGLYELFRRKARLIVVCDAGADPDYEFSDLANAIEKARVDFGVTVEINQKMLNKLIPAPGSKQSDMNYSLAKQSFLVANVDYHDGVESKLIYIKTTLSQPVSADIHGYKRLNPSFPDQTTADQFFDEVQFEAYRELGWQITQKMLKDGKVKKILKIEDSDQDDK